MLLQVSRPAARRSPTGEPRLPPPCAPWRALHGPALSEQYEQNASAWMRAILHVWGSRRCPRRRRRQMQVRSPHPAGAADHRQPARMLRHCCWRSVLCTAILAALLAAALPRGAALQPTSRACGTLESTLLARGQGLVDDAPSLAALDADPSTGLIHLSSGSRHLVASNLTLSKPLWGEAGARLLVRRNATLAIQAQPEHPLVQLFDVAGAQPGWAQAGQGRLHSRAAMCLRCHPPHALLILSTSHPVSPRL